MMEYNYIGVLGNKCTQKVPGWLDDGKLKRRMYDIIAYYREIPKHEPSFWNRLRGIKWTPNQPLDIRYAKNHCSDGATYTVYWQGQKVCEFLDNRAFLQRGHYLIRLLYIPRSKIWLKHIPKYQHQEGSLFYSPVVASIL